MTLENIDSCLEQIDELVRTSPNTNDQPFRMRLEELVRKGGRSTENAIAHYITGKSLRVSTRMNLVRLAGYIRSAAFLLPLQQIIETSEDDLLREEAIISVAKYNDRRALNILAAAMGKMKKPQLRETLDRAIGRLKSNNPFLAMLPRFLLGSKNLELFQITQKIFKKILGPADAKSFISYLHHGDQIVAEGAFEVLCFRGDESVFYFIAEYFREHSRLLARGAERRVGAARLEAMVASLKEYLRRYPSFVPQLRPNILALRQQAGGASWGEILGSILTLKVPDEGAPAVPGEGNDLERDRGGDDPPRT
jgi:hypothetical protein